MSSPSKPISSKTPRTEGIRVETTLRMPPCALVHVVSVIRYWLLYIPQSVQFHLHHYKTPHSIATTRINQRWLQVVSPKSGGASEHAASLMPWRDRNRPLQPAGTYSLNETPSARNEPVRQRRRRTGYDRNSRLPRVI